MHIHTIQAWGVSFVKNGDAKVSKDMSKMPPSSITPIMSSSVARLLSLTSGIRSDRLNTYTPSTFGDKSRIKSRHLSPAIRLSDF